MSRWISQVLERRQHTEALRVKDRAMDAAPVGIVITDSSQKDNPLIYANDGFERLTGYSESDIVGRNCRLLQGPKTRAEPVTRMRDAIDNEESVSVQLRNYRKDGTLFWDQVSIAPVRNENGDVTHFVGFQQDVTQQRHQQEKLEHREQVLREMYEITADQDRPFAEQAKSLLKLGRSELDTAYGTLSEIRGDEYIFELVAADDDSIKPGDVVPVSATNCEIAASTERTLVLGNVARDAPEETHRAGYTDWGIACYIGAPVYADDGVYGTFCFYDTEPREGQFSEWEETLVDLMSRWVSYELERDQREAELQAQNEQLEEFASIISHDLRNPLNVVQGSIALAEETGETEHFERGRNAADRMDRLIEDLLTLARQGKVVAETEPVEVAEIIDTCWQNVTTSDATLQTKTDIVIEADQSRFKQLIENLLGNAIEHGGESVTVTVGDFESGFYVEDDGPGIPEDVRDEVFANGFSTADDGLGFGLSIVRQIVDAHGWEITVAEGADAGARFEVSNVTTEM
jgi:PAS domain S-box-containing protein